MPRLKQLINAFASAALATAMLTCLFACGVRKDDRALALTAAPDAIFINTPPADNSFGISAHSAILIEMSSGTAVYQKNADERLPMASTTKIMTALVALESCDTDRVVTVSPEAVGVEGSSIYLFAGERITMEDLLYALLLSSANDAAAAIAIEIGGSIEGFADMMNARAREMGLVSTHFTNPHGLYDEDHYTTARELAIIAREAMAHSTFAKIVSTYKKTAAMTSGEASRLFVNHNKLLQRYNGACGIKTGFTKKSGRCLVSCAERDGLAFLCVTLNAPDDWRDHSAMLDLGFSLYERKTLYDAGELKFTLPVVSGMDDAVTVTNTHVVELIMPRDGTLPECIIELPRFAYAEITEGQIMGYAVFLINGREVARCPLAAQYSVKKRVNKPKFFSLLD